MAVYTRVAEEEIARWLGGYPVGVLKSASGISEGVENTNYLLVTERDNHPTRYILTLYEKRVKQDDLPYFLGLMEHLAQRGVPCPLPLHRADGALISQLCERTAALVSFLDGASIKTPEPEHLRQLGVAMAQMHIAAQEFALQRSNDLSPFALRPLYTKIASELDRVAQGLGVSVEAELAFLAEHATLNIPQGVIHADLFTDNVFFKDGTLSGIIDFYFACNDFLAYDLAVVVNDWCFAENVMDIRKTRALLEGYETVRPLDRAEKDALPLLCRGAALRFMMTRAHDWIYQVEGALVQVKDPKEYLTKWEFHRQNSQDHVYGI